MPVNPVRPADKGSGSKPVAGIILAAGCGSRMGTTKQLLPFEHTTLLGRVIDTARAAMLDTLILVLGSEAGRVRQSLGLTRLPLTHPDLNRSNLAHSGLTYSNFTDPDLTDANLTHPDLNHPNLTRPDMNGIHVVENPDWPKGQSFSVAAGLKALSPDTGGALFLLGDQPLVTVRTINRLVSVFQTSDHWIVAPCHKGQRGNPVLVAGVLFDRLKHPAGDAGARVLFDEFKHRMLCLDVDDPGILMDVDTPEDYAALVRDPKGG
jgi:molybdenum cofactor cytidylyltransferase